LKETLSTKFDISPAIRNLSLHQYSNHLQKIGLVVYTMLEFLMN